MAEMSPRQAQIKAAYDKVNDAWNAIADLQEGLREDGVPVAIVALLDETRQSVSDTSAFPALVEVIGWYEDSAATKRGGGLCS